MSVLAGIIGFLGPFGTYLEQGAVERIVHWWQLLMGAYLLIRPAVFGLDGLAVRTELPRGPVVISGVTVASVPLAILWRTVGQQEFRELQGYGGLFPFSLLCALAVLAIADWAERAERRLRSGSGTDGSADTPDDPGPADMEAPAPATPPLRRRLPCDFRGPILALQSEDHYVRVHGEGESKLVLMRLRDAISEMEGISGFQVHRSWWIARAAVQEAAPAGRSWKLVLVNGAVVPVARDSVTRLKVAGLLTDAA